MQQLIHRISIVAQKQTDAPFVLRQKVHFVKLLTKILQFLIYSFIVKS